MIENLFASQIWKCSLNVENSIKNKLLNDVEEDYQKDKNYLHPHWKCKVNTSLLKGSNIDFSFIIPYFKNEYEKFAKQLNLNLHTYDLYETWYNYYLAGYNQEFHDHVGPNRSDLYSMIYFLKIDDDHPKVTFYNYTNYHIFYSSKPKIKEIYNMNDINHSIASMYWELNIKEGDLIIFPSYMPHGVFVQKTDNPRITISSNLKIE